VENVIEFKDTLNKCILAFTLQSPTCAVRQTANVIDTPKEDHYSSGTWCLMPRVLPFATRRIPTWQVLGPWGCSNLYRELSKL